MVLHKYLIVTDIDPESPRVIIFAKEIEHRSMVPSLAHTLSAGFFTIHAGRVIIPEIGSTTLNLSPRPEDKAILQAFLFPAP